MILDVSTSTSSLTEHSLTGRSLTTRTIAIDDPGDLRDFLDAKNPLMWMREGQGLVGIGELTRIRTRGQSRFYSADQQWKALVSDAITRNEVNLPGTGPIAFGSFTFFQDSEQDSFLVVPKYIIGKAQNQAWLTVQSLEGTLPRVPALAQVKASVASPVTSPGKITYREGALSTTRWNAAVETILEAIEAGDIEKAVLAREVHAETERPLDARFLLRNLSREYHNCWTFSVAGMVGSTPELLIRKQKGLLHSRVLAGTIQRTGDEDADLARAARLAKSSKDGEEHRYAVESVTNQLGPVVASVNVPEAPFVLHLPNVMHLASDITAAIEGTDAPSSLLLAGLLHPTAAVCGTPRDTAAHLLREVEKLERNRYAAPIGWIDANGDGEWGIALRSALLDPERNNRLRMFAGCGIVPGSEPKAEWAESEAKLKPIRSALHAL